MDPNNLLNPNLLDNFPKKKHAELKGIYSREYFFKDLSPSPGAFAALNDMEIMGMDVRICISASVGNNFTVKEQLEWINSNLGKNWLVRTVVCLDKSIIKADILVQERVDIEMLFEKHKVRNKNKSEWKMVLLNKKYNERHEKNFAILSSWYSWKESFKQARPDLSPIIDPLLDKEGVKVWR